MVFDPGACRLVAGAGSADLARQVEAHASATERTWAITTQHTEHKRTNAQAGKCHTIAGAADSRMACRCRSGQIHGRCTMYAGRMV